MSNQNTGSVFANKATSIDGDPKLAGVQYNAKFGTVDATFAKAADDTLTIKIDGDFKILPAKMNNFGVYWIEELAGKRYFISERTNSKGKYMLCKLAKDRDAAGTDAAAPAAPKSYGKRA
jgi:hypothetical protein